MGTLLMAKSYQLKKTVGRRWFIKRLSRAKRRDANEPEIVAALEEIGATVHRLDVFDLLVGYAGQTHIMEVKTPAGKLTAAQVEFIDKWRGSPLHIVRDKATAIDIVTR